MQAIRRTYNENVPCPPVQLVALHAFTHVVLLVPPSHLSLQTKAVWLTLFPVVGGGCLWATYIGFRTFATHNDVVYVLVLLFYTPS